jgi:hypothetical protein
MRTHVPAVSLGVIPPENRRNATLMPALAIRSTGGTTTFHEPVSAHLAAEFLTVPTATVDRCVAEVRACAEHLGVRATPEVIERVAREHLLALVNSAPPPRSPR